MLRIGKINLWAIRCQILWDQRGQDLVEYALMGGCVATVAGAPMPEVAGTFTTVLRQVAEIMRRAAGRESD